MKCKVFSSVQRKNCHNQ